MTANYNPDELLGGAPPGAQTLTGATNGTVNTTTDPVALGGASTLPATATINGATMDAVSSNLATNPQNLLGTQGNLSSQVTGINENDSGTIVNSNTANGDVDAMNVTTTTAGDAATVNNATQGQTQTYDAVTTQGQVADNQMDAAQTTVTDDMLVGDQQIDTDALANGKTGTGAAINDYASQNIMNVIDTSTLSGKMLAQKLGEGNYTDAKATVVGQMEILTKEFTDPKTGEPKIPTWAAGVARSVSKIAAFTGVTGTAATAAMSQALIESTIQIAQADAKFFQTVTLKNLDNKQQMTINKANVLANMELANLDSRTEAAVNNANAFLRVDLENLENEQQARVVNTQTRVQAILEDANSQNVARRFNAESQNEMDKFYSSLNASIDQFNASQTNEMKRFNASETNSVARFNAQMENSREQFYKDMQYNIDMSNAKWRQSVTVHESSQKFQAAATDVQNMVGISTEQLNRLWDRADSILDYTWKSAENDKERASRIEEIQLSGKLKMEQIKEQKRGGGLFGFLGKIAGSFLGSVAGTAGANIGNSLTGK